MDVRDFKWDARPAGNTLIQQIEILGEKLKVPAGKRKNLRWLAENLRTHAKKDKICCCELKMLLGYVQLALQQGIDNLSG